MLFFCAFCSRSARRLQMRRTSCVSRSKRKLHQRDIPLARNVVTLAVHIYKSWRPSSLGLQQYVWLPLRWRHVDERLGRVAEKMVTVFLQMVGVHAAGLIGFLGASHVNTVVADGLCFGILRTVSDDGTHRVGTSCLGHVQGHRLTRRYGCGHHQWCHDGQEHETGRKHADWKKEVHTWVIYERFDNQCACV